jgi:S-adenosylmethionine synthetase
MVSRHVRDPDEYLRAKGRARQIVLDAVRLVTALEVDAAVNVGDDPARGELFLTVTGTSAEAGDDGEVGRGNRACGLITPYRPMTLEAAAGKNPVSHVGKLYNVAAKRVAAAAAGLSGVRDAWCVLVSRIGQRVDDPDVADVHLSLAEGAAAPTTATVADILRVEMGKLEAIVSELIEGRLRLF